MKTLNQFLEQAEPAQEPQKEDPKVKQAQSKENMLKKRVLMTKIRAVRGGAEGIMASYEPNIEGVIEYFYEEGINEEGFDQLIEEIGLEEFVNFVDESSLALNEERAARRATVRAKKYDVVKKEVDKADAARKKAKKGEYAPSYAKKETDVTVYDDKPAPKKKAPVKKTVVKKATPKPVAKKPVAKKVVKAVAKVKKTQPVKKPSKQGLGDRIRSAYKAGVKRHRKATQVPRVFAKGAVAGAKKAVKFAKDVKKVVSEANRGEKEVDASDLKKVGRRNINRFETGTVKRTESSGGRRPTYKTVTLANPKPGYGKKSDHYKKNKLSAPSLGRHGTSSETEKGPQKHHTQGVTYHDAAQQQRRQEHKSRRGVKTKGTVAADIKKSLKKEEVEIDEGVMKFVKSIGRKKPEKKAQKAMDAGAIAKRKLARRVHAKYVSGSEDNVPDDIREAKRNPNRLVEPRDGVDSAKEVNRATRKAAFRPFNKEEVEDLKEYSPNVTYQAKGGRKSGKLGKSSVYSLKDKGESKKEFRKSQIKDIKGGYLKTEEKDAYKYVVSQLKKKYGDGVLTKGDKIKPPTAAQKKAAAAHRAKVDRENAAEFKKDPSQGRYPKGYSNRGSD